MIVMNRTIGMHAGALPTPRPKHFHAWPPAAGVRVTVR